MINVKLLSKLVDALGVAGFEEEIRELVKGKLEEAVGETRVDQLGNIYASIGEGEEIVFEAHMDEVGFIVSKIEENGFIRVQPVGGIDDRVTASRRVKIYPENGKGSPIHGLIAFPAPHVLSLIEKEEDKGKVIPVSQLWVDIGASDLTEVKGMGVTVGCPATFDSGVALIGKDKVTSKSLDDRLGCLILLELAQRLSEGELSNKVTFQFSVQEEMGCIGSFASKTNPALFVAVDSVSIADHPNIPEWIGTAKLGKGPVLRIGDRRFRANMRVTDKVEEIAGKAGIRYQLMIAGGTTDAYAKHMQGVPSIPVCFPLRYTHTPNELASLKDCEEVLKLLMEIASNYL